VMLIRLKVKCCPNADRVARMLSEIESEESMEE
jgi:hypothetical protein